MRARQVAVCGPRECTDAERSAARDVGALLAEACVVVLCGGGSGVMAAAVEGARSAGGLVIGIRPGDDLDDATPGLSAVIATGMGEARNAVLVRSARGDRRGRVVGDAVGGRAGPPLGPTRRGPAHLDRPRRRRRRPPGSGTRRHLR